MNKIIINGTLSYTSTLHIIQHQGHTKPSKEPHAGHGLDIATLDVYEDGNSMQHKIC